MGPERLPRRNALRRRAGGVKRSTGCWGRSSTTPRLVRRCSTSSRCSATTTRSWRTTVAGWRTPCSRGGRIGAGHEGLRGWGGGGAGTDGRAASHAMPDPVEAAAWRAALQRLLPDPPARVLDVGAGTGALSLLAAELGHRVTGVDLSQGMLDRARAEGEAQGLGA